MSRADSNDKDPNGTRHALPVPPSYFACKRRIERLKRFQDLIRCWETHKEPPYPIEDLIGSVPEAEKFDAIERAISRLVVAVGHDLDAVGVSTGISMLVDSDDIDEVIRGRRVREDFNLIDHYFDIPHRHDAHIFNATMRALDEGIGAYELMKQRAKFDFINPLAWCAWVLRAPVIVLQRAGIATGEAAGDKALRFFAWMFGVVLMTFLILLSVRLGISIPWNALLRIIPGT